MKQFPVVLVTGSRYIGKTTMLSEILKSYLNAGKTIKWYSLSHWDKMTGNPTKSMIKNFQVLDLIPDKKRGTGTLICLYDRKTYLTENDIAIPLEYI